MKRIAFFTVVAIAITLTLISTRPSAEAAGPSLPKFEADPYWPKPLPNNWILGEVSGVAVDARDHVWIIHRPRTTSEHDRYQADGKGDCEDYALMKRKILIDRGFPRQALLITVVRDEQNEGHAILTVKTNSGEYILDNLNDDVKAVSRVPYRLVKRQSQEDPNVWVALGPVAPTVVASR